SVVPSGGVSGLREQNQWNPLKAEKKMSGQLNLADVKIQKDNNVSPVVVDDEGGG
ncbi:10205_t:CDS:2, partial [Cetraspora pellucida]